MSTAIVLAPPPTEAAALPAAASTSVADLITGRRRTARVVASTTHALIVAADPLPLNGRREDIAAGALADLGNHGPRSEAHSLVCLSGPQAVRLPCALLSTERPPTFQIGTSATVGGGLLRVAGMSVRVGRWWKPPQPRITDWATARQRAASLALPPLEQSLAEPAQRLAASLHEGGDLTAPVRSLLGLGCGLTPGGDDVIAGALVALHAAGSPGVARLADTVTAAEPARRTTIISAGLLHHAARGEAVPELAALLAALDGRGQLSQAMHRLLAVGHSSGTALCHGAVLAVASLRPPPD